MSKACPFVPSKDITTSIAFYEALGFEVTYRDESVATMDYEGATIVIQPYFNANWARNWMAQLRVDDLDEWWKRTEGLAERFEIEILSPPAMQPWGKRTGFLSDPSDALWHIVEE
ncbi:VOC family protein [Alteraurantiacibacter aquimixticola]|uniref:Glyoxalase n=1 Tax=Alteraurantiacibacter aquimixticola TaxID=2489173 RepID=A0A4T3EZW1_9SPHN|nr:VOC family protein [Alteraurantiacibacter aquimixticola]TIX50322.1 glyoxalase [Alteraurantiacibacter aquimixticola]